MTRVILSCMTRVASHSVYRIQTSAPSLIPASPSSVQFCYTLLTLVPLWVGWLVVVYVVLVLIKALKQLMTVSLCHR